MPVTVSLYVVPGSSRSDATHCWPVTRPETLDLPSAETSVAFVIEPCSASAVTMVSTVTPFASSLTLADSEMGSLGA